MKHYRSCNLCAAICGLGIETDGRRILSIKGDRQDPLSRGHICPKALALNDIHEDPDRLKNHLIRPAADVFVLAAMLNLIFREGLQRPGRLQPAMDGLADFRLAVAEVTPARAASLSDIAAAEIERMAREFAAAEAAVCYGRMGVSTQVRGGLC